MAVTKQIKIISGGQTGVDRAALDFALENNIACGGWCPKGRIAEDGTIGIKYPLREISSTSYPERTRKNILDSNGTLIIYKNRFDKGTGLTRNLCEKLRKPYLVLKIEEKVSSKQFYQWLLSKKIKILNVAGPRESFEPGIYFSAKAFLQKLLD